VNLSPSTFLVLAPDRTSSEYVPGRWGGPPTYAHDALSPTGESTADKAPSVTVTDASHTRFPDALTTVTPSARTAPFGQGVLLQLARPAGPAIATMNTAKPFRPNRRASHHPLTAHRMPALALLCERRTAASSGVHRNASSSACDGDLHPRVCRGLPLSSAAKSSRSACVKCAISVRLGKY